MPKIYDNIKNKLKEGLNKTLENAKRADFCIGYFNLRGWRLLYKQVDNLSGSYLAEEYEDDTKYHCRVLIGMQRQPVQILEDNFSTDDRSVLDNAKAIEFKKKLAKELKEQLIIGTPNNEDEKALRKLSRQIKAGKVIVKLHLAHPLHAKLYLSVREDYNSPVIGFVGSSNLTFSGISNQGELNVDVVEQDAAEKLSQWYQDRWDNRWSIDISKELTEILDESWASDGFHLSDFLVKNFPFNKSLSNILNKDLYKNINGSIKNNSVIGNRNTKKGDIIEIEEFKISKSKAIIDQIDTVLAKHYNFTEEELDFIINYDIKYRMGKELDAYIEGTLGKETGENS